LLGFDAEELARLMDDVKPGLTDPDDVPAPPDKAITQPGDIWTLGDHRLMCADSTKPEHVAALMNGQKAKMMFTEPPWGVAIGRTQTRVTASARAWPTTISRPNSSSNSSMALSLR
jgi:hypothetical protein